MDLISRNVQRTVVDLAPTAVIVPTATGHTARMISRFKLPVWIVAASPEEATCHGLQFSYGVHPVYEPEPSGDGTTFARLWVQSEGLADGLVVLTEGPSRGNPEANYRLEIIDLRLVACGTRNPRNVVPEDATCVMCKNAEGLGF